MNIVIIGAYPNSIISFRGELIKKLVKDGHQVTVMSAQASNSIEQKVNELGASYRAFAVQRNGLNPLIDLKTLWQLIQTFRTIQPDRVLAYTIKPVIWGGIAAKFFRNIEFYGLITGLGYAFERGSWQRNLVNTLVKFLYRQALKNSAAVIFQNEDNKQIFINQKLCTAEKAHRVYGSGVDLSQFSPAPLPDKPVTFLLIARLLGDKGIREYAQAAEIVKQRYPEAIFQLLGPEDSSPDKIAMSQIAQWQHRGAIEYLGETDNVLPFIQQCHIYTLPSYHEGLPRTVLEAMAVSRPILTTDVPGCRDTVIAQKNGKLVVAKDGQQLANAMMWFIENSSQWQAMADESRRIAVTLFDVNKVNQAIVNIMQLTTKE